MPLSQTSPGLRPEGRPLDALDAPPIPAGCQGPCDARAARGRLAEVLPDPRDLDVRLVGAAAFPNQTSPQRARRARPTFAQVRHRGARAAQARAATRPGPRRLG